MSVRDCFDLPPAGGFEEMIRRRRGDPCILCGRRRAEDVMFWPVYPEYAAIVGTPPGALATISVGLCKKCRKKPNALARAKEHILRLVAERARAKGLPMPATPSMPVIEFPMRSD